MDRAELEARLAEASKQTREAEASLATRESLAELQRQVEEAERKAIEIPKWIELLEEYGEAKLAKVDTLLGMVVVKRPHAAVFRSFQDKGKTGTPELMKLVQPCVVYPDKTKLDVLLDEQPGVLIILADKVTHLAGIRTKDLQGK